jgi:hypothetical protein
MTSLCGVRWSSRRWYQGCRAAWATNCLSCMYLVLLRFRLMIPIGACCICDCSGAVSDLTYLGLFGSLSGTVPTEVYVQFCNMSPKTHLTIRFPLMVHAEPIWDVPISILRCSGKLSNLEELVLVGSMSGTIPTEMYVSFCNDWCMWAPPELSSVVPGLTLCLGYCILLHFRLTIPIGSCCICGCSGAISNLTSLWLFGSINGTVPNSGQLDYLWWLGLDRAMLTGPVPSEM